MTSSASSSPSFEEIKSPSADADATPKASPLSTPSGVAKDEEQDDADRTLTMPSTSQGHQSSPTNNHSVPSSQQEAYSVRRIETPPGAVEQEYYYFTTDMANQAALDIEKEKEKFDSLITWYKLQREDVPALGTSSVSNSAAPSYVSDKGSTTPMSSQPSSHQSGTSSTNGAHSGHNGFNYSPYPFQFGLDNNPTSNDPMQCMSSPVDLDEICPTLEDFISGPSTSATSSSLMANSVPSTSSASKVTQNNQQQQNPTKHITDTNLLMLNPPSNSYVSHHHPSPLNPLSLNQQMTATFPSTSDSNPPSNSSLKRRATSSAEDYSQETAKQAKLDAPSGLENEQGPMRRLEMMANAQNFRAGNTINEVVEASKKDERALKMEKLEGIEKSVEEEMAQQAREAHMKRMQQTTSTVAGGVPPAYPSPGQYPGAIHPGMAYPGMPVMPPHPGMPMMPPGAPFSAGASYPTMGGPFPPHPYGPPIYPGITPGGYPMSAPGKMPFGSPTFSSNANSPAAMAAMHQGRIPPGGPPMPPHPSMMTPQQHQHFMQMQQQAHIAQFHAHQKAAAAAAAAAGMSPNMAARASPSSSPFPQFPPNQQQMYHMMMMRAMQSQGQFPPGMPGAPGHIGMPGMPNGMPGIPQVMPGMPGMPPQPAGPPNPQNPALLVAGNRVGYADSTPQHGMGGSQMWQLTPHYPPPFPSTFAMPGNGGPSGAGPSTPR